jgi:hypothetical protein
MVGTRKAAAYLAVLAAIGFLASPAFAGLLTTGAYNDGSTTWSGSTPFTSAEEPGLNGYVDWVVYAADSFPYAGTSYTPTAGELVYAYQIVNTGTVAISQYKVYLDNDKEDNHGTFSATGVTGSVPLASSGMVLAESAWWDFGGIAAGASSQGMVFSSPNKPQDYSSYTVNHGGFAYVEPVPAPSSDPIPEPSVLVSLLTVLGSWAMALTAKRFYRS